MAPAYQAALAQNNPNTFTLPEQRPTPTPSAPPVQGPADERAGVPIAPRVIVPERRLPGAQTTPAPDPAAPIIRRLPPEPTPTATPSSSPIRAPSTAAPDASMNSSAGETATARGPGDSDEVQSASSLPPVAPDPSSDLAAPPQGEDSGYLLGEDDWVDVPSLPQADVLPVDEGETAARDHIYAIPEYGIARWIWIAIALALVVLGLIAALAWRSRRASVPQTADSGITSGLRERLQTSQERSSPPSAQSSEVSAPEPAPVGETAHAAARPVPQPIPKPTPAPPASGSQPERIALSLAITSATRSVMMFTLEYRLTIANRSDQAVRHLSVSAQLTSAQRGSPKDVSSAAAQPIGTIERIGPQQAQAISAVMQIPMTEVRPIRQGSTPVFIPLLHVLIEGDGIGDLAKGFVVGVRSDKSQLRLHPIALDTPPGSVSNLRADEIRGWTPSTMKGEPA